MAVLDTGADTAGAANVDSNFNLQVVQPGHKSDGTSQGGGPENGPAIYAEIDPGGLNGLSRVVRSPGIDADKRMRVTQNMLLDREWFNYGNQNLTKHNYQATVLTNAMGITGFILNSASINTAGAGASLSTWNEFPLYGGAAIQARTVLSFGTAPDANATVDFGLFRRPAAATTAPVEGVYFRASASGMSAVMNTNSTEVAVPLVGFAWTINKRHEYVIRLNNDQVDFWIDGRLWASIPKPDGQGAPTGSGSLPWSIAHRQVLATTVPFVTTLSFYDIEAVGTIPDSGVISSASRTWYSYVQPSGSATQGSLGNNGANNFVPVAALPVNTALTANLIAGLGGQCIETDTLAANTDGILMQYRVPLPTTSGNVKRLAIYGIKISSFGNVALTGGGYNALWKIIFNSDVVAANTADVGSLVSPSARGGVRRVTVGTNLVPAALAVGAVLPDIEMRWSQPIICDPGSYVMLTKMKIGTAPTAGAIHHVVMMDYAWI